jgi:hypothetical protein
MESSSASRVFDLLKRYEAVQAKGLGNGVAGWAAVFEVEAEANSSSGVATLDDRVYALLADVRAEIRAVESTVLNPDATDPASSLARRAIQQVSEATNPRNMGQDARAVCQNYLTPDVMTGWAAWAVAMPKHEDGITPAREAELRDALAELEAALQADGVPARLRQFAQRQAELLRDALRRYPVRGADAVGTAVLHGLTELVSERDALAAEPDTGDPKAAQRVFEAVRAAWNKGATFGEKLNNIVRLAELAHTGGSRALPVVQEVVKQLAAMGG